MLPSRVNQHNPTTSRALRNSGRISSTPGALPPRSFLTTSVTSASEIGEPTPRSPGSASSMEGVLTPYGGPESPRNRTEVIFHGLSELLPRPSFCLSNHPCRMPLGLPVPVSCFRSPTGQKGPIGLLLQPDSIPHRRCPPAGSRIAATTGTDNLAATAQVGRFSNGGAEHGPLGLNIPNLPRNVFEALPEVGVEAPSDRKICGTKYYDVRISYDCRIKSPQ
ncbi:uncharacterized protein LOC125804945 [Astyanax mexicanus]|uniref:uncharacterized protein LOC125804945 n=1 Tax=Astyanax mexicanus TaxID=7994 RepID=UPI0020CB59A3|nr:uncharacterized protein LOC125804945 [Astyanax mexicanus]